MPLMDCMRNTGIASTRSRICPHYYFTSDTEDVEVNIPVIKIEQNDKHLFTAAMNGEQILKMAKVPALKWTSENYESFATDTYNNINGLPSAPTLWQRPLDLKRELNIRNYFYNGATRHPDSIIPGAIVLGELDSSREFPHTAVVQPVANIRGVQYYNLHVRWKLRSSCRCGWTPPNGDLFFDRCGNHTHTPAPTLVENPCPHGNHTQSTSPFQIIDGQHRTMGLMRAGRSDQAPVVFMLGNKIETRDTQGNVTSIAVNGTSGPVQAKIFEKVNNSAEGLKPDHILWIKRLLTPAAALTPDQETSFDLAAYLGSTPPRGVPGSGVWRNMISFQPITAGQTHSDSRSLVEINGGSLTGILGVLDRYERLGYGSKREQLVNFLNGACTTSPSGLSPDARPMFYGADHKPFRSGRMFSGIIRAYELIAEWAIFIGGRSRGCLNHDNFTAAWNLHSATWGATNLENWKSIAKSGENSAEHIDHIHKLMWPAPTPGTVPPPSPPWYTNRPCTNWTDYVNMAPDPIKIISPGTKKSDDSVWNPNSADGSTCKGTCGSCLCGGSGTCQHCICSSSLSKCSGPIVTKISSTSSVVLQWEGPKNILGRTTSIRIREFDNSTSQYKTPIDPIEMMVEKAASAAIAAGHSQTLIDAAKSTARSSAYSVSGNTHTMVFNLTGRGLRSGDPFRVEITDINKNGSTECILLYELR